MDFSNGLGSCSLLRYIVIEPKKKEEAVRGISQVSLTK